MTQHISDIVSLDLARPQKQEERRIDQATANIVNELFHRFSYIYPSFWNTFKKTDHLNSTKKEWMLGFIDCNINTSEQLERGLQQARRGEKDFMPTLGQFMKWCEPNLDDLGVPALDAAYMEACKNSHFAADKLWTHKLVQHAWKLTGSYLLATSARSTSYPLFKRNYEEAIKQWRAGKHIDEIEVPKVLTKIADPVKTAEMRRKSLKESYIKLGRLDLAAKFDDGEEI